MTTLSLIAERKVAGPLSAEGNSIFEQLRNNGETETAALLKTVGFMRSRFYKAVFDLKNLGVLQFNHQ